MKNLAIIPARGGSKRLPRKNIKKLCGKPLIGYTIEAVIESNIFDTIILSSDDDEILEVGTHYDEITIEKREPALASDTSKVIDLIKQIADRPSYSEQYDAIGLFLPTCPFRTSKHIKEGFSMLQKEDFSVVSINEMQEPVQLTLTLDGQKVINPNALINPSPLITGNTRSQDFDKYYRVNGGFYIAWLDKFITKDNFFQGIVKGYEMPPDNCVDIDNEKDFLLAEYLLKNNHIKI